MTGTPDRLATALVDRYRIERELGAGGMATVYLAHDVRHDRHVAIKVLKPELAAVLGAERFVQEIKTTAALSHPHILPLFDSGEADGFLYYVMPYIQGETIREKLNREAQFGVDDAVRITTEVADALDYAHRHGVIHRDIKPENILLHDGRAMVMDFGIALAVSAAAGGRMTETGLSLGTPHYMSPEQATAEKDLSGRSDIYSLATVLYEMLTGQPPHLGASAQQIIMKIIVDTPRPVTELRKSTPPHVAAAVAQALEKLPADRFATAGEFAAALFGHVTVHARVLPSGATAESVRPWRAIALAASAGAVVLAVALGWSLTRSQMPGSGAPVAFAFRPVAQQAFRPSIAISDDGRRIVVQVRDSDGVEHLALRDLGSTEISIIPGTEEAEDPAFSPDGKWLSFNANAKLKKVPVTGGGPAVVLADSLNAAGSWTRDGHILYAGTLTGVLRVPSSGGVTEQLTTLDSTRREFAHWYAQELPGGKAIIYNSFSTPFNRSRIDAFEYATRKITTLVEGAIYGRYVDGYLLYMRDMAIFAAPFDPQRLRTMGPSVPVVEDVAWVPTDGAGGYAVSPTGTLVYLRASAWNAPRRVVWVDRAGNERPAIPDTGQWAEPRLSPDGRWIALTRLEPSRQIWLFDRSRQVLTQVTRSAGASFGPVWAPDSRSLFHIVETPVYDIAHTSIDGTQSDTIIRSPNDKFPSDISRDGALLGYGEDAGRLRIVLRTLLTGATSVDSGPISHRVPAFSPDGRWVAYQEDGADGKPQVFIRSKTGSGRRQVSSNAGSQPRWTKAGREVVFRAGARVYAASFDSETGTIGTPALLFSRADAGEVRVGAATVGYDVTPDGSQFLMVVKDERPEELPVVVITNWLEALRKKVPRRP